MLGPAFHFSSLSMPLEISSYSIPSFHLPRGVTLIPFSDLAVPFPLPFFFVSITRSLNLVNTRGFGAYSLIELSWNFFRLQFFSFPAFLYVA